MYILLIVMVVLLYLLLFAMLIANYVMQSYAQYTLAQRRGINNPWLVWIPVVGVLITGQLAEDYDKQNGVDRKWGKTLLILSIVASGLLFLSYLLLILMTISVHTYYSEVDEEVLLGALLPFYLFIIPASLTYSALMICRVICFFKIFESTVPHKALKYLILSHLVPFAHGICLLKCRNQGYEVQPQAPASPFVQSETDPLAGLEDDDLE